MTRKIPPTYIGEFLKRQTSLVKSRVNLLCMLAMGIYFLATALSILVYPQQFKYEEIPIWVALLASVLFVLYLNKRIHSLGIAKCNAFLFTVLLLALLTKAHIIYCDYVSFGSLSYVFLLFLVSFTIPWNAWEIMPVALMHVAAYRFLFLYTQRYASPEIRQNFDAQAFLDGSMLFLMALIFCMVIRRKETVRDRENFILLKDVEEKNRQMQEELWLATQVHKTLIPKSLSTDRVDIAVMYLPLYFLSGDYGRFHFVDKDRLVFIICDVTGHGVSAALLVNRIHTEFERLSQEGKEPGLLLKELDAFIIEDFAGVDMYLSAFCGMLDFKTGRLLYSNHGHPPQYVYRVTKSEFQHLDPQTYLLGISLVKDEAIYQNELSFSGGDHILLFTDGVIETMDRDGQLFGRERLEDFIRENHSLEPNLFNQRLLEELHTFKSGDFKDDIFVLNIQVK